MTKAYKILPNQQCPEDVRYRFEVKDGEYVKLSGYGLCEGVCVRINQIHEDKCNCYYDEKPYCLFGSQLGMDENCTEAVVPMPGCYVAYLCLDDDADIEDLCIYMNRCRDLQNLQTVLMALGNN